MKGDIAQENRQVLDTNADTVVSDSRAPGLMILAWRACSRMAVPARKVSSPRPHASILQLKRWRGAPKAKRLTSSNPPLAARRRVVMPVPCCLRNAQNKLRAVIALPCDIAMGEQVHCPLRRSFGRTIADLHGQAAEVDFESPEAQGSHVVVVEREHGR